VAVTGICEGVVTVAVTGTCDGVVTVAVTGTCAGVVTVTETVVVGAGLLFLRTGLVVVRVVPVVVGGGLVVVPESVFVTVELTVCRTPDRIPAGMD